MPSFETSVDFEVYCGRCNAGLCSQTTTRASRHRGTPQAVVEPCDTCLETSRNEGYNDAIGDLEAQIESLTSQLAQYTSQE